MLRIKEVAKSKGVSLIEIAEKLGISNVSLSNSINGNPTIETLLKIANVLEVDVRDLIEPTTATDTTPLYIKDDNGNFQEVGALHLPNSNLPNGNTE